MNNNIDHKELAREMIEWFSVEENYSVVQFAVERGLSREKLFRLAGEDGELQEALDYALSVQEHRVCKGAITGFFDKVVALKMLETYSGWKGDVNILQKNEYKQFMMEAKVKAEKILRPPDGGRIGDITDGSSDGITDEDTDGQ